MKLRKEPFVRVGRNLCIFHKTKEQGKGLLAIKMMELEQLEKAYVAPALFLFTSFSPFRFSSKKPF